MNSKYLNSLNRQNYSFFIFYSSSLIIHCGLLKYHICYENGGGAMIEAVLLEIIYLLLFGLVVETIIVFALIILVIILSK